MSAVNAVVAQLSATPGIAVDKDAARLVAELTARELEIVTYLVQGLTNHNEHLAASVTGPSSLAGFGSAHPAPPSPYTDNEDVTWQGRALAVMRAGREAGQATLEVTSQQYGAAIVSVTIHAG